RSSSTRYLCLQRKRAFPMAAVVFALVNLAVEIVTVLLNWTSHGMLGEFTLRAEPELAFVGLATALAVPYLLVSERVRVTFTGYPLRLSRRSRRRRARPAARPRSPAGWRRRNPAADGLAGPGAGAADSERGPRDAGGHARVHPGA